MNTTTEQPLISENAKKEIDGWLKKYPSDQKRSAVLSALRIVQEEHGGWLTNDHMDAVAEYLDLPKIAVYEVGTFYGMFNLKPVGKYRLAVCNNISCMLNGSEEITEHLEKILGIKMGETTCDGNFTLKEGECLASCVRAPVLQLNDKDFHDNLTIEKVDELIEDLKKRGAN
jgi:NADH-quinone oxidoreductase subunit E